MRPHSTCILAVILLVILHACSNKKSFAPESYWSIETDRNTKKVVWYKVTQPLKNTGSCKLYLQMDNGDRDTSVLNVTQLSLSVTILESGEAYYNDSTKHLIAIRDIPEKADTAHLTQKDTLIKKPF